jgi:hypothetical protein
VPVAVRGFPDCRTGRQAACHGNGAACETDNDRDWIAMNTTMKNLAAAGALAVLSAMPAGAAAITLDFEGVGDLNPVGGFYSGLGAAFSPAAVAVVDSDAGGSGNFANEPSPDTVMILLGAGTAILDFAAGFTTGFSFFYSSSEAATVNIYDDLGGTGNLLASLNLAALGTSNCTGDPDGSFCNWTAVGVLFSGIARSIDFSSTASRIGFDDITLGSGTPGVPPVPAPAALPLMLLALGGLGAAARRRRG